MQESIPQVYDRNLKRLAFLQNASQVGYTLTLNALHTARFTLPAQDEKNEYCQPMNFVEIYDGSRRVELFRIIGEDLSRSDASFTAYTCEHVLATLLNDILFQYHQIGGPGVYTAEVLRYILDRQVTKYWQLGRCDFRRQFEYKWENTNLLAALFSVPNAFTESYVWTCDTTARPWRIHLTERSGEVKTEIRYKKNMQGIRRTKDSSSLVTRLYPLGYGEGDNQLTVREVNNGAPYLDAETIPEYGLVQSVFIDRRFESPDTLLAYARTMLDILKTPYLSYEATAADLARYGGAEFAQFGLGDVTRVIDQADGISVDTPIVEVSKDDVRGAPQDIKITLANKTRNIASSIADLQNRALINEAYAQGATNQMMVNFADNCDPEHPAVLNLYVPDTMARINKCVLHYELEPFRSYSRGVTAAEDTTSGPSSANSSGASSINTSGPSSQNTSGPSSRNTSGPSSKVTTDFDDERAVDVIISGAEHRSDWLNGDPGVVQLSGLHYHNIIPEGSTDDSGSHGHSLLTYQHIHYGVLQNNTHQHGMDHDHSMDHTHSMDHDHSMEHNHGIGHDHTVYEHNHETEYGIYEGSVASSVRMRVDGNLIPVGQSDIDITRYFAVDGGGKILRNTWHKIEVIPDTMTRITANIFFQIFTNSRGGGDY